MRRFLSSLLAVAGLCPPLPSQAQAQSCEPSGYSGYQWYVEPYYTFIHYADGDGCQISDLIAYSTNPDGSKEWCADDDTGWTLDCYTDNSWQCDEDDMNPIWVLFVGSNGGVYEYDFYQGRGCGVGPV